MTFTFKKSQVAAEFLLLSGLALVAAIVFISISLSQTKTLQDTKEFLLIKDIALKIQSEISIASNAEDGYSREFELPEKILFKEYNTSTVNNTLTIWTNTTVHSVRVLDVTGNFKKKSNTITKTNGIVRIN